MARPLIGWKRSATNNTGPDLQVTTVARSHRHPPFPCAERRRYSLEYSCSRCSLANRDRDEAKVRKFRVPERPPFSQCHGFGYDGRTSPTLRPMNSISSDDSGLTVLPVASRSPDFLVATAIASEAVLMAASK
jgi:hypothetical protein